MTPVLALRNVGVRYPSGVWGCREVSFELYPGEVLGIVGESGSGKSTVLACANLDIEPTEGSVEIAGVDAATVRGAARRQLRARGLGIVYQTPQQGLDLDVSAGGNVAERMFGAGDRGYDRVRARALELHAAMELPVERFDVNVRTFSGGMRQRVQLAKALATSPPALLLDEPTSGLDVSVQAKTLDLIRRIQRMHGLATVIVSHDLAVIRMLADRLLVMRQGRVVERGLTDQILDDPQHPYAQLLVASQLA
jgi:phosphonate C-P lyase system protein PhnK